MNQHISRSRIAFAVGCTTFACATFAVSMAIARNAPDDMDKPMPNAAMTMPMESMSIKQAGDGVCVMPGKVPATATKYFEVTIKNNTRGQFLSPPLFVTHAPHVKLWAEGEKAMPGVVQLAETGLNSNLAVAMRMTADVCDVVAMPLPILPGEMGKVIVRANDGDVISALAMLAVTNDGFTGLSNAPLKAGDTQAMAYDVGHEENNERSDFIPAKLGTQSDLTKPQAEIKVHEGIKGGHDLDKVKEGWDGPVATFTIREVEAPKMDNMGMKRDAMKPDGMKPAETR